MQVGWNSTVLCGCAELSGNKRPWIRWPQVGKHVRGLVVCPIVCGGNRQMNNQPAVSLESKTVYHNLPSSLSPHQPANSTYLFFSLQYLSLKFHQKALSSESYHRIPRNQSLCIYSMSHLSLLSNLCSRSSSPASIITPFSLFAPPPLILFLTPMSSHPLLLCTQQTIWKGLL